MFCTNCGSPIPDGDAVCPECGAPAPHVAGANQSQPAYNQAQQAYSQAQTTSNQAQPVNNAAYMPTGTPQQAPTNAAYPQGAYPQQPGVNDGYAQAGGMPAPSKPGISRGKIVGLAVGGAILAALAVGYFVFSLLVPKQVITLYTGDTSKTAEPYKKISGRAGGTIVLPDCDYKWDHHRFAGWSDSISKDAQNIKSAGDSVDVDASKSYYGVWENELTFDGNGADSGEMDPIWVISGEEVTFPLCEYKRSGYTFAGWLEDKDDEDSYPHRGGETSNVYEAREYYANWIPSLPVVNVTLKNSNGEVSKDIDGWTNDTHAALILAKNETGSTVNVTASFSFMTSSGSKKSDGSDMAFAVAPGQTCALIANDYNGSDKASVVVKADESGEWSRSINGSYKVDEITKEPGKLVISIKNTGSETIEVNKVIACGEDSDGNMYVVSGYAGVDIAPNESTEVEFDASDIVRQGVTADWGNLKTTFYVGGDIDVTT